jgi:hypothetical protein
MNQNQDRRDPGTAAGDGQARHGSRTEVSWNGGKGRQPYSNQGAEEQGPATAGEYEAGNRGDASGRNLDQLEEVKEKPERPVGESRRET